MFSRLSASLLTAVIVLAGCVSGSGDGQSGSSGGSPGKAGSSSRPETKTPNDNAVLGFASSEELATAASQAFFTKSPVVVLAHESEALRGVSSAAALGVPVLIDGAGTAPELERLEAEAVLAIGPVADPGIPVATPANDQELAKQLGGIEVKDVATKDQGSAISELREDSVSLLVPAGADDSSGENGDDSDGDEAEESGTTQSTPEPAYDEILGDLPDIDKAEPVSDTVVLTSGGDDELAAVGTAIAAGAAVINSASHNPVATSDEVELLAQASVVLAFGERFGDEQTLEWHLRTAETGVELPGGGQRVLPGKTYVALYGHPGSSVLGVLGEQDAKETIARAEEHAEMYSDLIDQPVVPALEIIATIASATAGPDGDYSTEGEPALYEELIDLAGEHGMYVVLDLQPGRTDFLTQAKRYEELLKKPWVGLALDTEWRLLPNQKHLTQIGHVEAAEVDTVVDWLADLVKENDLPQKLLILHQFQVQMIRDIDQIDLSHPELAVMVHVDGQGSQGSKQETWRTLLANAPDIEYWGWKNFYEEDIPGPLSPEDTVKVAPRPDFVSYQ